MSDTMSAMSTKQYRPSSRSWIKLWVNEWLTGTVRWQLTPQQRSIWADLLALAGRSRFPGIVCSGETNGVLDPFPMDYLCSVFRCAEPDVKDAFHLFVGQSRITINEAGVIQIVNWDKYQSEYQLKRQRRQYNEPRRSDGQPNVRTKSKKTPPEEVEVEVEGEGEIEEEKKNHFPTKTVGTMGSEEFRTFWNAYPKRVDRQEALRAWVKGLCDGSLGDILAGLEKWKSTEQWTDPDKIPYPSTWLNKRRWKEAPEGGKAVTKHERNRQITRGAVERLRAEVENS